MEHLMDSFRYFDSKYHHPTIAKLHHPGNQANYHLRHDENNSTHHLRDKTDGELMKTYYNMSTDEVLENLKKNGYLDGHKEFHQQ